MTASSQPGSDLYEVIVVKHGTRQARRSEVFLNYDVYGEPDGPFTVDYYLWIVRSPTTTVLVDTGFARGPAERRGRTVVTERGDEGVARIKDLTHGLGAHSVIEAVGTQESMMQAIRSTRPGGHVGYVGSPTACSCPARNCSSPTCTCTAAPPRYAASCPS